MQNRFIAAARACLGTPFRHQGRVPGRGLDCIGLVIVAARGVGITVSDDLTYAHSPDERHLRRHLLQAGLAPVALNDDAEADLLLLRFTATATHVAIRTDIGVLHAYAPARAVIETPMPENFATRIAGRYRFAWPS